MVVGGGWALNYQEVTEDLLSIENPNMLNRLSYQLVNGPIPEGLVVLHSCDNPSCVNPKHLSLGTQKDNMQDMIKKGRKAPVNVVGELNPKAVLSEKQVREIKRKYSVKRTLTLERIGEKYNVGFWVISKILNGKLWSHVN